MSIKQEVDELEKRVEDLENLVSRQKKLQDASIMHLLLLIVCLVGIFLL